MSEQNLLWYVRSSIRSTETLNDNWIKCRKQSISQYLIDFLSFGSIFSSDFKLEIRFNCNKPVLEVWVAVFKPLFLLVNYSKPYPPIGRDGCFNISARTSTPLRTLPWYTCKMKILNYTSAGTFSSIITNRIKVKIICLLKLS